MTRLLTIPSGRRAKWIVFVVMLLVAFFAGSYAGKFEDAQENETSSFLPGGAESVAVVDKVKQFPQGEVSTAVTVIARDGEPLGPQEQQDARQLIETLNGSRTDLMEESSGPIPSEDGQALLVITPVQASPDDGEAFLDTVTHIRDEAHQLRGDGVQVEVTGAAGYGADAIDVFGDINGQLLLAAGGLVLILLILIYRSPIFWAIPFFTVLLAEVSSRGFGYLLSEAGVTINGQTGGDPPGARVRRRHGLRAAARLQIPGGAARATTTSTTRSGSRSAPPARRSSPPASR